MKTSKLILKQFKTLCHARSFSLNLKMSQKLDAKQEALLEEQCILVNEKDEVVGKASKRHCHLLQEDSNGVLLAPLHRAFSLFLFNGKNELLLQRRSQEKITFPAMWTNTCCSHPLYTEQELISERNEGVHHAVVRRMKDELGIADNSLHIKDLHYLTRIHYSSPSLTSRWGENEIDYIFFCKKDIEIYPNSNEIMETKYLKLEDLNSFMKECEENEILLTPWFRLIATTFLPKWWQNLDKLKEFIDHQKIHKF